ncbi:MAG TPA: DUF4962 domain-containing protein, partial [Armatimonadota bacterium]|nr:DUF4962 domain-containing protein [Armatimonadota bacterium]
MRPSTSISVIALLAFATVGLAQENLFVNSGFEDIGADGRPTDWLPVDFGTGGTFAVGDDGGHAGDHYVILGGIEAKNRSCWQQGVLWDDEHVAATVTGWYRTVGVAAGAGKGASIRFCFNGQVGVWEHLDLKTAWYPPAEEWTEIRTTYPVPEGTSEIFIQPFQWYAIGETHWDDMAIRPATEEEVEAMAMDPSIAVDRDPVHGRNLPYWPADGETVKLNPPPFRWLPSGATATYRLQIDRTDSFDGDGLREFADMPWCARMLSGPLATGTWHWRYGVDGVLRNTVWSQAREFTVTEDASPWPYPGREALKVPEGRPRLFLTRDELADYRQRASEGDLRSIADGLLGVVRKYADEELVPEPDFLPSGEARRNAYTLTFRATRPPMDRMERIALAYVLTGDEEAAAQAKRRVLHFFSWDPQGSTGIFHNDEPAMWIMMRGTRAYDWTYDLYTDEEREMIEGAMRVRASDFYKQLRSMPFENNPFSSHPGRTIGFLGEAALEFQDEWPEASEWLDYITQIYWG